jgi:hypothetical protein
MQQFYSFQRPFFKPSEAFDYTPIFAAVTNYTAPQDVRPTNTTNHSWLDGDLETLPRVHLVEGLLVIRQLEHIGDLYIHRHRLIMISEREGAKKAR